MTFEEAKGYIGGFVRFSDGSGHPPSSGKVVRVTSDRVIVRVASGQEFTLKPEAVTPWRTKNAAIGFNPTPPAPIAKAEKIQAAPAPIESKKGSSRSTHDVLTEFDAAVVELEEWEGLCKTIEQEMKEANDNRDTALKAMTELQKELNSRINFPGVRK